MGFIEEATNKKALKGCLDHLFNPLWDENTGMEELFDVFFGKRIGA